MNYELPTFSALTADVRAVIVEDHPVFAHGLRMLVGTMPMIAKCESWQDGEHAWRGISTLEPDLVLLDLEMLEIGGFAFLKRIVKERAEVRVIVISDHAVMPYTLRALRAGARGYVQKTQPLAEMERAIETVLKGEVYVAPECRGSEILAAIYDSASRIRAALDSLSPREKEVFRLMGHGRATREMAEDLGLSVKTVETHRVHIREKLSFKTSEAMLEFAALWVEDEDGRRPVAAIS